MQFVAYMSLARC